MIQPVYKPNRYDDQQKRDRNTENKQMKTLFWNNITNDRIKESIQSFSFRYRRFRREILFWDFRFPFFPR